MRRKISRRRSTHSVIAEQLEELLAEDQRKAIPQAELIQIVKAKLAMNPSQLPHVMQELKWYSDKVKWGSADYARAIWVKQGCSVSRGKVTDPDGNSYEIDKQPGSTCFELVEAA